MNLEEFKKMVFNVDNLFDDEDVIKAYADLERQLDAFQHPKPQEFDQFVEDINKFAKEHYGITIFDQFVEDIDSLKREVERLKSNWENETNKHTFSRFIELEERCAKLEEALREVARSYDTSHYLRQLANAALKEEVK